MKAITKILSPSLKRTILIINFFFSAYLKTALRTLQIEGFKKHLMTKNTPYITTAEEIKKYASISKI